MSRQTITPLVLLGSFPALQPAANSMSTALLAEDVTNHTQFKSTGKEILLAFNSDASDHTVTVNSVVDERRRTGDITSYNIVAGQLFAFGAIQVAGWAQSDGNVYLQANSALVKFAVLTLP